MWTRPQRILRLRLAILDTDQPIERTVELDAASRLEHLHGLIQSVFTWSGDARHVFTDRRSTAVDRGWGCPAQQRVWEMDHHCRDNGHVSECEWTATVASAFESTSRDEGAGLLFYEFGVEAACPRHEYGSGCLVADLGAGEADHAHGFTVAIEVIGERAARRAEHVPTLLDGCGRAPMEETGSAGGYAVLNAMLDDPTHPRYKEFDELARRFVGPWAATGTRAFAVDEFEAGVSAQALDLLSTSTKAPLPAVLIARASATHHRQRLDVLASVSRLGLEPGRGLGFGFDEDFSIEGATAQRITVQLAELLHRVAAHETDAPGRSDRGESFEVPFLRSLRLVIRRHGELGLTRAGERVADDPAALLATCGDAYWRVAHDPRIGLYVLIGVAHGFAGDDLAELVIDTAATDRLAPSTWDDARRTSRWYFGEPDGEGVIVGQIEQCIAFLTRFGVFAVDASQQTVRADGRALALSFLTR